MVSGNVGPSDVLFAAREYVIALERFLEACVSHVAEHADHTCAPKPARHPTCVARDNARLVHARTQAQLLELASKYSA